MDILKDMIRFCVSKLKPVLKSKYSLKIILLISLLYSAVIYSADNTSSQTNQQVTSEVTNIKSSQQASQLESAEVFTKQADALYNKKLYLQAIEQYTKAAKILISKEQKIQKRLGSIYTRMAESYKRIRDRKKTVFYYKKALDAFVLAESKKNIARTLNTLAQAERYLRNYVEAIDYATRSLGIHQQINDPKGRVKTLNTLGIIYRTIGRYEKAFEYNHEAFQYYKKINDPVGIAKTSNQIGLIYTKLKQFDLAQSFYQETINLNIRDILALTLATALREMAVIHLNNESYSSAMLLAKRAQKIYQQEDDNLKQSLTARIIAKIFRAQGDDSNAKYYYRQSLAKAIEEGSIEYQIKAQTPLASIIIGTKPKEAISLLKKSVLLSQKINAKSQTLYAYHYLRIAAENKGDLKQALDYAKLEIQLTNTINKQENTQKLQLTKANLHSHKLEMDVASLKEKLILEQLETEKKNNQIKIADQTRIINELKLIKNRYASFALGALLICCVLILILLFRRFKDSKQKNKELDYLASRDPLTNCYNRRTLFNEMKAYFSNADLHNEYCIIMVDIDHFKHVNDTHGHGVGDIVIQGVASTLQHCVRQSDIVARFGGEEFCVVLHQVNQEKALKIAESMRENIEKSVFKDIFVTASFGVSSIKFNAKTPSELINQADTALYKSKATGRNKVTLWNASFVNL